MGFFFLKNVGKYFNEKRIQSNNLYRAKVIREFWWNNTEITKRENMRRLKNEDRI